MGNGDEANDTAPPPGAVKAEAAVAAAAVPADEEAAVDAYVRGVLARLGLEAEDDTLHLMRALLDNLVRAVVTEAESIAGEGNCLGSQEVAAAVRKVLPGAGQADAPTLRPFLPAESKRARQLDKQSLGSAKLKRQRNKDPVPPAALPAPKEEGE